MALGSDDVQRLILELRADISGLKQGLSQAERAAATSGSKMQQSMQGVAMGVAAVGAAYLALRKLQGWAAGFIESAKAQQVAQQKLATALGFTSRVLLQQANTMQQSTRFSDEAVLESQSLVGAFIKEEKQIQRLMPLIADFAEAKGMDLRSAADLVTKSIASGTNALSRYGIKITDSKDRGERLESVVRGLSGAFGGMAEAIGRTPAGILEQQKNLLDDMAEEVGMRLIPWQIEWNKLLLETLQGWGHIYKQVSDLFDLSEAANTRDKSVFQQQRDYALRQARAYGDALMRARQMQAEGAQFVGIEIGGMKQTVPIATALAHLEQQRAIALGTAARQAKSLSVLLDGKAPGAARKSPSPLPGGEDAAKKAEALQQEKERAATALAVANAEAVLKVKIQELALAQEQLDAQYAASTITIQEYYEQKRALAQSAGDVELAAIKKKMGLEMDAARFTSLSADFDAKKLEIQQSLVRINAEEAKSIADLTEKKRTQAEEDAKHAAALAAKKHEDELSVASDLGEIQRRSNAEQYQSYTQRLANELAALDAKHAEEIRKLQEHNATVAQLDAARNAQAVERQAFEQQSSTTYYTGLLATASDVANQISAIYSNYYDMVREQETANMNAAVESARARGASEEELERLRTSLQAQANSRAKQAWEKQKRADLASAIIGTALAVVSALQTKPFYVGLIMAALAGAAGGVQIAKISQQTYPGLAEGGMITTGTTTTADDVPARLSRGEFVSPAASVDYYGSGVYEAMRRRALPRDAFAGVPSYSPRRGSVAFAQGGIVGGGTSTSTSGSVTVLNYLDAGLVDRFLATPRGQRAVVNVIEARSIDVQRALG